MWSASTVYFSGGFAGGEGAPGVDNVSTADGASSGGLDGESGLVRAADGSAGRSSSPSPFFVPRARHCGRTGARTVDVARLVC